MSAFLSLGRLHIPIYGLFAAMGLMAGMALSQWTSPRARLDPEATWNAGLFAIFSAFLLSRMLLVAENFRLFLRYPVGVLELPSLSLGGIFLTLIVVLRYLRRKRLPFLQILDAAAPCVALLWAFLSLGEVADGTREGMPSTLPWAWESSFGRVHPVEIYAAVAWLALCGLLLWMIRPTRVTGETGAWGLGLGGLVLFLLNFFHLPWKLYGTSPLDPIQLRALALIVAGGALLAIRMRLRSSQSSLSSPHPGPAFRDRAAQGKDVANAI